jgi:hypothetical protein
VQNFGTPQATSSQTLSNKEIYTPHVATATVAAASSLRTEFIGTPNCFSKSVIELWQKSGMATNAASIPCAAPELIVNEGNNYVVSHLGKEYISKYLTLQIKDISSTRDANGMNYWDVSYIDNRFVTKLKQSIPLPLSLKIFEKSNEVVAANVPDCVHNPVLCEINVTEQQALETARLNGLSTDPSKIFRYSLSYASRTGSGWAWYLVASDPAKEICGNAKSVSKTIEINIGTGQMSPLIIGAGDCIPLSL